MKRRRNFFFKKTAGIINQTSNSSRVFILPYKNLFASSSYSHTHLLDFNKRVSDRDRERWRTQWPKMASRHYYPSIRPRFNLRSSFKSWILNPLEIDTRKCFLTARSSFFTFHTDDVVFTDLGFLEAWFSFSIDSLDLFNFDLECKIRVYGCANWVYRIYSLDEMYLTRGFVAQV